MAQEAKRKLDDILEEAETNGAVCLKNDRRIYTFANEGWSNLASVPIHLLTGKSDEQLPWALHSGNFIQSMDETTRRYGRLHRVDRLAHFERREWMHTITERRYLHDERLILCIVRATDTDEFCRLANQVSEKGIFFSDRSLSIRQLYLLHQLLFQVPQKQTARELGCSVNRINQCMRELREYFEVEDNKELLCILSAYGLFPLLERFDQIFKSRWVSPELIFA